VVPTPHLDTAYERELASISQQIGAMAAHAQVMVSQALQALAAQDAALAAQVCVADTALDRMEVECDRACVALLARRAPVAADLRLVAGALKLVTDLERIGDLAVNIAERSIGAGARIGGVPPEVTRLGDAALAELALSLAALTRRDCALAGRLRSEDATTDAHNRAAFDRLLALAGERPDAFEDLLALTSICRQLERIGDHAVNIGEMVVYMVDGRMVRHQSELALAQ
jgi:phosphate transport system protein